MDALTAATIALATIASLTLVAQVVLTLQTRKAVQAANTTAAAAAQQAAAARDAVAATLRAVEAAAREADATLAAAEAARDQADSSKLVIEEMRADRALAWQPYLVVTHPGISVLPGGEGAASPSGVALSVINVGRGLAFNVRFAFRDRIAGWYLGGTHQPIPVGGTAPITAKHQADAQPRGVFEGTGKWALLCEDEAGNRYRFIEPDPRPAISQRDDPSPPEWVIAFSAGMKGPRCRGK